MDNGTPRQTSRRVSHALTAGLAALFVSSSTLALGASLAWNGSTSGNWFTSGNWTPSSVPTAGDALIIDSAGVNTATISSAGAAANTVTIGSIAGSNGALVVTGAGTLAVSASYLTVGDFGTGALTISAGGKVTSNRAVVANNPFSSGTVTITGAGSQWTNTFLSISADNGAVGRVRVEAGGKLVSSGNITIGEFSPNADGQLVVTGSGSDLTMNNAGIATFIIGADGKGDFQLLDNATAATKLTYVGGNATGVGTATVSGGAKWTTENMFVGPVGTGTLTVSGGGQITTTANGILSSPAAGITNGKVTVTGANSQWKITGVYNTVPLAMGSTSQTSELNVLNGGTVLIDSTASSYLAADARIANTAGSRAAITIDGAGSSFTTPYRLYLGNAANSTATVTVSGGGKLNTGYAAISSASDATSATADTVTVTGAGSLWAISDTLGAPSNALQGLTIGSSGKGVLTIADGGVVRVNGGTGTVGIGALAGSSGTLNIGAAAASPAAAPGTLEAATAIFSSTATAPQAINFNHTSSNYIFAPKIDGNGPGAVNVIAGTTIFTADNTYTPVTTIYSSAVLQLGNGGTTGGVTGNVTNNGTLVFNRSSDFGLGYAGAISGSGQVVKNGAGTITITGTNTYTGGTTINSGQLNVGNFLADGTLTGDYVNHGKLLSYSNLTPTYSGVISGEGSFEKSGNGTLTLNSVQTYTGGTKVTFGRLIMGGNNRLAASGALTVNGGIFDLNNFDQTVGDLSGYGRIYAGTGSFTAGGAADTSFTGLITGSGTFTKQGTGTLTMVPSTTFPGTFTGTTKVNAGTLLVNGSMASSTFQVNAGGTLGGTGSLGATTVANGGTLQGIAGQTLTMASLTLNDTSNINVSLGAANTMPLFDVTGALTLDGKLSVSDAGGFGNGTYRIANYGGTLTNNGLVIGTVPPGFNPGDWSIQSGGGVVNLLVTTGAGEQYWDGANMNPGGVADGRGGNGTWDSSGTNWTNAAGDINAAWASQKAVFAGTPGTVSVVGAQTFTGLRFVSHPTDWTYTLAAGAGGGLVTNSAATEIIVAADPGASVNNAIINVGISGTGSIVKLGDGTLTLGAANSYQGGTTIREGELVAAANGALGTGGVSVTGAPAATLLPVLRFAGPVSAGSLSISTQNGSVVFDNQSSAGTAGITNQGDGKTVFLAGSSAGSAVITNQSGGTTAFRGDNASNAATIINHGGGKVDLSSFDAAGPCNCVSLGSVSGAGDISLGAHTLRTGALNFDETISGVISDGGALAKGSFTKDGTGKLILANANTYLGTTTVNAGILRIDGSLGSAGVTVASGATLGGNGTIGTLAGGTVTIQAGGHHAPGASIGSQTINGNYKLAGTLDIEIDPTGADRVVVTGNVDLTGGTLALHELTGTGWQPSQTYTIIDNQGANAVTGQFADITHVYAFLTPDVIYTGGDGNNVVLTLTRNAVDFSSVAATPNQKAAAGGIESLGAGNPVYNAIAPLSADGARFAFDQLSGEVHAAVSGVLLDESRLLRDAALGRVGATIALPGARGFWMQGAGLARLLDSDGNAADVKAGTGAFFAGTDAAVGDGWTLGFLGGIGVTALDVDDRSSSADVTSVHLGAYGGGMVETVQLKFGAGYSHHDIDTRRNPAFSGFSDALKASYGANTVQVFGEASRAFDVGAAKVEPFAGVAYVHLSTDGFAEEGGTAALASDGGSNDATFTTLGARVSQKIVVGDTAFEARASLGWRHAFADLPAARLSFAGGDAFTVTGVPIARDALALQAGFDLAIGQSRLGFTYDGQFASGAMENAFKASFSTRF